MSVEYALEPSITNRIDLTPYCASEVGTMRLHHMVL